MTPPRIDSDGFYWYQRLGDCHQWKLAALFTPTQLTGDQVCRSCIGEVNTNRYSGKGSKPTLAQQPRMAGLI